MEIWIMLGVSFIFICIGISIKSSFEECSRRVDHNREIHSQYPLGTKVQYLDTDMLVVGHGEHIFRVGTFPAIHCEYKDSNGIIRSKIFREKDLPLLTIVN